MLFAQISDMDLSKVEEIVSEMMSLREPQTQSLKLLQHQKSLTSKSNTVEVLIFFCEIQIEKKFNIFLFVTPRLMKE